METPEPDDYSRLTCNDLFDHCTKEQISCVEAMKVNDH
jgi:hypothetical protein